MALYKSLVRPHLEFYTLIWSPYLIKDIKLVGVQQRATKRIQGVAHRKYDDIRIPRTGCDLVETL